MPTPSFPTLSRTFKVGIPTDFDDNTVRTKMEDGLVQTYPRGTKIRRTWQVSADRLTAADYAALDTFCRTTVKSGAIAFNISIPAPSETVLVRFTKFQLAEHTQKASDAVLFMFTGTVEEV